MQSSPGPDILDRLVELLESERSSDAAEVISARHPSEIADLLEALPPDLRMAAWRLTQPRVKGEILIEAHEEVREGLIRETNADDLVRAVEQLDMDELADLYQYLPAQVTDAVLRAMDHQRRRRFEGLRSYLEDTAGGLMNIDTISVRSDVTLDVVQRYLRRLRHLPDGLPESLDSVYVVDRNNRYLGILPLRDLVSLDPENLVVKAMRIDAEAVEATTPASRVAKLFSDHDLISAPVVSETGELLGRITVDDVVDVIREEAERSVMGPAGLDEEADLFSPVMVSARKRTLWLGINLINALVASWVIGLFEATIEQFVALAILMPIIPSMGGVAGIQTLTLVTRAISLEQIGVANAWKVLSKEVGVGLLNGIFWAILVSILAALWFGDGKIALVFALALIVNLVNGAASGCLIPMILHRLRIDPAIAGGVLLIAATDILGFFCFLGFARLIMG